MRHWYAAQSPRGFANEIVVHTFGSRAERDRWVTEHEHDGGVNSAAIGAVATTAKRAHKILNWRGDATTESFNGVIVHDAAYQHEERMRAIEAEWFEGGLKGQQD